MISTTGSSTRGIATFSKKTILEHVRSEYRSEQNITFVLLRR